MVLTAAIEDGEDLFFVDPLEEAGGRQPSRWDGGFVVFVVKEFLVVLFVSL